MVYMLISIMGLILGSFLNVCIYRLPKNESIVTPGSHCVKCGHKIKWYENIPVLSFLFLRAKCSGCGGKISFIYPLVEILAAGLACLLYSFFGLTPSFYIYLFLFASFIVVSFIDFDIREIPDVITLPGIVIGLATALIYPQILAETRLQAFLESFLGIIVGGGSLYILGFFGELVFKKEAMGGGDIKLLAMIGAFIGWKLTLLTFFIAPFCAVPLGIFILFVQKKETIPYGPFLALSALTVLLWGNRLLEFLYGKY